jgi:hypothetical protein
MFRQIKPFIKKTKQRKKKDITTLQTKSPTIPFYIRCSAPPNTTLSINSINITPRCGFAFRFSIPAEAGFRLTPQHSILPLSNCQIVELSNFPIFHHSIIPIFHYNNDHCFSRHPDDLIKISVVFEGRLIEMAF